MEKNVKFNFDTRGIHSI